MFMEPARPGMSGFDNVGAVHIQLTRFHNQGFLCLFHQWIEQLTASKGIYDPFSRLC
jgi:hypothetical protein